MLVVFAATALVWIFAIATPTIADQATIATGLDAIPIPTSTPNLPSLTLIPGLLVGSLSIAIVALAQGAGIAPRSPTRTARPRTRRATSSARPRQRRRRVLPIRPHRRVAVAHRGERRRRSHPPARRCGRRALRAPPRRVLRDRRRPHPEAVIGGLLLVIGVELVVGRIPDARLAWRADHLPRLLFIVTLLLTLAVPLQGAILAGTILSLLAYVARSATSARLRRINHDLDGWLLDDDIPATLPPDEPLLVRNTGPNFFAAVTTIVDHLPAPDPDHPGVLVLDLGQLDR